MYVFYVWMRYARPCVLVKIETIGLCFSTYENNIRYVNICLRREVHWHSKRIKSILLCRGENACSSQGWHTVHILMTSILKVETMDSHVDFHRPVTTRRSNASKYRYITCCYLLIVVRNSEDKQIVESDLW